MMGIPTPGESRRGRPRIRESGMWAFGTVRRILTSETYMGVFRYGRMGGYHRGKKRSTRPKDELIALEVPPVVSREVWEAAQERRNHNKRISGKKRYLLRGMVVCECGRKMTGSVSGSDISRYRCGGRTGYFVTQTGTS
jgi:site-specific DNA recombinase